MKNILLLYKKLYKENKTIVLLYLLLFILVSAVFLFTILQNNARGFANIPEGTWWYPRILEESGLTLLSIISVSFVISIHWGIRHFNYSPQSYYYNTLPISTLQKFGFILSYIFLFLPVLHVVLLSGVYLGVSSINVAEVFGKTPWGLYMDMIDSLRTDYQKRFFLTHFHLFMAIFVLIALFFNKMGFIKTVVVGFVTMLTGTLLFIYLNNKFWETRGDFGTALSAMLFPGLYTLHYVCITVFFVAILYTVYTRLTDKNY